MHCATVRPSKKQHAQALVELAFVLPVMLLMTLGMIDLVRAFVFGVAVQNGAREAARVGSLKATGSVNDTAVRSRLIAASAPALIGCSPAISTAQACGGATWTLNISVVGTDNVTYSSLDAVPTTALSGAQLTVTAAGTNLSMLAGLVTGMGLRLSPINAQGQAVMMVL